MDRLYGEDPPERGTFSGWRCIKGKEFHWLKYSLRVRKTQHLGIEKGLPVCKTSWVPPPQFPRAHYTKWPL